MVLENRLKTLILKRGDARRLAVLSGVDPATISRALKNGLGHMSIQTAEKLNVGLDKIEAERKPKSSRKKSQGKNRKAVTA